MNLNVPLFALLVCSQQIRATPLDKHAWTGPRVVFTAEQTATLADRPFFLSATDPKPPCWTVSNDIVERADVGLLARIATIAGNEAASYGRQYFGLSRDGHRVVFVLGFCHSYYDQGNESWKHVPVSLLDAGTCAFGAEIDPASAEVLRVDWGTPGPA
jgi:hypothetical protein